MYYEQQNREYYEKAFYHIARYFLSIVLKNYVESPSFIFPILQNMAGDVDMAHMIYTCPSSRLDQISNGLLNLCIQINLTSVGHDIVKSLTSFQKHYLREKPGELLKTKYMTVREFNQWYGDIKCLLTDFERNPW